MRCADDEIEIGRHALTLPSRSFRAQPMPTWPGLGVLISWLNGWTTVGAWFTDQSRLGLMVGWPLLLGALFAAAGYVGLRRVVP